MSGMGGNNSNWGLVTKGVITSVIAIILLFVSGFSMSSAKFTGADFMVDFDWKVVDAIHGAIHDDEPQPPDATVVVP